MAAIVEVGRFTANGGPTQTVPLTKFGGLTPQVVIIWDAATGVAFGRIAIGATDGSRQGAVSLSTNGDGGAVDWQYAFSNTEACYAIASGGVTDAAGTITPGADDFDIAWSTSNALPWGYMAIGGGDVSAEVRLFTNNTSTGTQSVSTGFQPKAVLFISNNATAAGGSSDGDGILSIGAMDGTNQACVSFTAEDSGASATDTYSRTSIAKSIGLINNAGAVILDASFSSFGATSFTLSIDTTDGTAYEHIAVVLGGNAEYRVKDFSQANTSVSWASAMSNAAIGLIVAGSDGTVNGTVSNGGGLNYGAYDGTTYAAKSIAAEDASATNDASRQGSTTNLINAQDVPASNNTIGGAATVTAIGSSSVSLNWGTDDARARKMFMLGIGRAKQPRLPLLGVGI